MLSFPNCKINLGLNITRKREDGYHDLETVFYPIALKDSLEIIQSSEFTFQSSGLPIDGDEKNNLCVKAYRLLKQDFPGIPTISIHLHKAIPMGAGLGGGSADGAFTLSMLNKKFKLGITEPQLLHYALQLGSDCPFFVVNKPCFATGRGEKLQVIDLDLSAYTIVLVNPKIHVSTKEAFADLIPQQPTISIREIVNHPVEEWRALLKNDFEAAVFKKHPAIAEIKTQLYDSGAKYAAMTGTGSTVFGLFRKDQPISTNFPPTYFTYQS